MNSPASSSTSQIEPLFVGREKELAELLQHLREGRHTLLVGEKGIGKSSLIAQAIGVLDGTIKRIEYSETVTRLATGRLVSPFTSHCRRVRLIRRTSPMGDFLRELAGVLHIDRALLLPDEIPGGATWDRVKKYFVTLGRTGQEDLLIRSLEVSSKRYILFLDSLDRISPTHLDFLERSFGVATVCAAVVRPKEGFQFKKVWNSFVRIDVGPLPREAALQLVRDLIRKEDVRVADPALFEREVLKASGGNPFHIRNHLWHTSRRRHLGPSDIRALRRHEEGEFFNMGPVYIFAASALTLFKIFSLGMGNREFYIYFSALGFLVYLTFRVFRTFFLFRPQRWGR